MHGRSAEEDPQDASPPVLPLPLAAAAFATVVAIVGLLIVLLFRETTGPGEVLHDYYAAVSKGDCKAAYALLSATAREETSEGTYCEFVSDEGRLPEAFTIESILLRGERGETAEVTVSDEGAGVIATWTLSEEEGAWRIASVVPDRPVPTP